MKNINWKILNLAFWIEIFLSYLLPFKIIDNFQYKVGFPIPFITIYNTAIRVNPLMSMQLNPLALLLNAMIIYLIISLPIKASYKFKTQSNRIK